jgi:hypothetical protein
MKKTVFFLAILLVSISYSKSATRADTSIVVNGTKYKLCVNRPTGFNSANNYPLIVALHYCGGSATEYCSAMAPVCDSLKVIVVSPEDGSGNTMSNPNFITVAIDSAKQIYNIIDTDVYLTGMSCNGEYGLKVGLNNIYPFKGIFLWAPYVTAVSSSLYNFDSKMPTVISIGTGDSNFGTVLSLYDSLKAHGANVNFEIVQGIAHTLSFAGFGNEMIRCYYYLNDTNAISISQVEAISIYNTDSVKKVKVAIVDNNAKNFTVRAISSNTSKILNPVIVTAPGSDTVVVRIIPKAGKTGKLKMVLEAAEVNGTEIEQIIFEITILDSPSGISTTTSQSIIEVFPVPAHNKLYYQCNEKIRNVTINDITGKQLYSGKNSDKSGSINISSFPRGIYFVSFYGAVTNKTFRILFD